MTKPMTKPVEMWACYTPAGVIVPYTLEFDRLVSIRAYLAIWQGDAPDIKPEESRWPYWDALGYTCRKVRVSVVE